MKSVPVPLTISRLVVVLLIVLCASCGELAPTVTKPQLEQPVHTTPAFSPRAIRHNPVRFLDEALRRYRLGHATWAQEVVRIITTDATIDARLSESARLKLDVLRAHLAFDEGRHAFELVAALRPQSDSEHVAALEVWARALESQERYFDASATLMRAKRLVQGTDLDLELGLNDRLWLLLLSTPRQLAREAQQITSDPDLQLWWELVTRFNDSFSMATWHANLKRFQQLHPDRESVAWLAGRPAFLANGPKHIAVLLPQSGNDIYTQAARGIRDGWLLAYLTDQHSAQSPNPPTLTFYDSTLENTPHLIREAFAKGADLVVGPLTKDAVNAAYRNQRYPGPVLMLNTPDTESTKQSDAIRYLAWSIEDEALKIAQTLSRQPELRAVLIYGEEPWMLRARAAFEQALAAPARVVSSHRISDFSQLTEVIGASVGIAESMHRHERIESIVNYSLEFQPRMNQEINSVVAFINASQLEAVLESLRFHADRQLDVYVTDRAIRGDLPTIADGVQFTTDAWRIYDSALAIEVSEQFNANPSMTSFYALGIDAYRFSNLWSLMNTSEPISGTGGLYQLEPSGNIRRLPHWGIVRERQLKPLREEQQTAQHHPYL